MADNKSVDLSKSGDNESESSSNEHDEVFVDATATTRRNPYRKVIVEKRPRSQSSNESDKENKRLCVNSADGNEESASSTDGGLSPLYPNQMSDPRVQALVWQEQFDEIEEGTERKLYKLIHVVELVAQNIILFFFFHRCACKRRCF